MSLTNYLANFILNDYFTQATYTPYLALHITDPTNAGLANTELTTAIMPTYARKQITFGTATNRTVSNSIEVVWTALPVVSIGYLALWDHATVGNLLAVFPADPPFNFTTSGGTLRVGISTIVVQIP